MYIDRVALEVLLESLPAVEFVCVEVVVEVAELFVFAVEVDDGDSGLISSSTRCSMVSKVRLSQPRLVL